MSLKSKAAIAAGTALSAACIAGVLTYPASASTAGCTSGVYSGYCGTQASGETNSIVWDVYQQRAAYGQKIIGYPDSSSDQATDFFTFAYAGGTSKIFEYAPGGVASNLCVSEPAQHAGLVLRVCNGSAWQQFTAAAAPVGDTWTDKATGDIVASGGIKGQLTGVTAPPTLTGADEWAFL